MLTDDGAKFVMAGQHFILVTSIGRLFWDNDRLEWTAAPDDATIFAYAQGMEEAGNVAGRHLQMEQALGRVPRDAKVMIEDVTDKVQARRGRAPGDRVPRRLRM